MQKLIINADDFGIDKATSQSIIDCHDAGTVTSTTLMTNMPAAIHAVNLAKERLGLGVGLHFNLTLGKPISSPEGIPSLVQRNGLFYNRKQFEKQVIFGLVNPKHVKIELEAQLNRAYMYGIDITHLDSHQHVHQLPSVTASFISVAASHKLPIRIPWQWEGLARHNMRKKIRAFLLGLLLKRNKNIAQNMGVQFNDSFASLFDLTYDPGEIGMDIYRKLLENMRGAVCELMVHPVSRQISNRNSPVTSISEFSYHEYDVLVSSQFRKLIENSSFDLVNYSAIND